MPISHDAGRKLAPPASSFSSRGNAMTEEADYGEASKIDEMLEKRFQYGLELQDDEGGEVLDYNDNDTFGSGSAPRSKGRRGIEDDDEDLNDETFGDIGDIDAEFDFTGGRGGFFGNSSGNDSIRRTEEHETSIDSRKGPSFDSSRGNDGLLGEFQNFGSDRRLPSSIPMTVEEVEMQMRRQLALRDAADKDRLDRPLPGGAGMGVMGPQTQSIGQVGTFGSQVPNQYNDRVMSVTEVEAALVSERSFRPMSQQSFPSGMKPHGQMFPNNLNMGPTQMGPGPGPSGNFMPGFPMRPPPPNMGMRPDPNFGRPPNNFGPGSPRLMMNMPMRPMGPNMGGPGGPGGPGMPNMPNMPMRPHPNSPQQQQQGSQGPRNRNNNGNVKQDFNNPQQQQRQRQEYGQMRYGDRHRELMQETERFMKDMPRNYKGPPPLVGGWGGRRDHLPRWERYRETMTHYEKETIAKIQIAQLVTDDPLSDDFYYQIHSSLQRGDLSLQSDGSKLTGLTWQQSLLVSSTTTPASGKGNSVVLSNQMQQQMQKLIEGRKQKPKGTSLSLEGALGKISLNSVRNPKQLIQIQPSAGKDSHSVPEVSRLTGRKILRSIETVYSAVLTVEHMKRKGPPADEDINEWKASLQDNVMNVWKELHLNEPVPFSEQHPFLYFLSFAKGKKVLPRIIGLLAPEQILAMLTTILARAESLDVCNMPAGTIDEQIDLFITNVIPCLVAFVTEVPLHVVNACMRILLERHNMVWLARSKVGLAFLTMLLSRAEILKQGGGAAQGLALPSPEDLSLWSDLYNFLFASLHNHFASIFPPSSPDPLMAPPDEVYVWQFFAAMAVGATTIDHQRVLVTEVRTKVIETSRRGQRLAAEDPNGSSAKAISNVNLFLNALGLGIDASQLAAMG